MTAPTKWAVTANIGPPEAKKFKRLKKTLKALGIALLVVLLLVVPDLILGLWYRTGLPAEAEVIETAARAEIAERVLIVFPGHGMSGKWAARALERHVPDDTMMLTVHYAPRGIDTNDIYNKIMEHVKSAAPQAKELIVYGASMGGMCAADFLRRYSDAGSGPVAQVTFVLDSAPSSKQTTHNWDFLYWLASWYRGGPFSTLIVSASRRDFGVEPEADADPLTIEGGEHAGDWVGAAAMVSQADYIARFPPLREGEFADVVTRALYLTGHGPENDPVVDVAGAEADWRRALPMLTDVVLPGRDAAWHVPLLQRPREVMEAIFGAGSLAGAAKA